MAAPAERVAELVNLSPENSWYQSPQALMSAVALMALMICLCWPWPWKRKCLPLGIEIVDAKSYGVALGGKNTVALSGIEPSSVDMALVLVAAELDGLIPLSSTL